MKKYCWFLIFAIIMLTSCGKETDTVRNATVSQEEVVEVYDSEALAAHIAAARALLDSETETRTSDEVLGKIYPDDPETEPSSDEGSNKSTIGYSDIVSIPNDDTETQDQPRAVITSNPKPEAVITSNSEPNNNNRSQEDSGSIDNETSNSKESTSEQASQEGNSNNDSRSISSSEAGEGSSSSKDSSNTIRGNETEMALKVIAMGRTTGDECWIPRLGGSKYHSDKTCSGMDDPVLTTVHTAEECGFGKCKKCYDQE